MPAEKRIPMSITLPKKVADELRKQAGRESRTISGQVEALVKNASK